MCGICGWIAPKRRTDRRVIEKMCSAITHRGPDDWGCFSYGSFAFGMRRLSIIDLESGSQPIHNEDRTKWIVLNGEIYNYRELKEDLEAKGHRFSTKSDTETVLHLYEEYGDKAAAKLRGMFAFAIFDSREHSIYIARDRFGIKPLFYYWDGKDFIFASEIKSILSFPRFKKRMDPNGVSSFFTFGYVPHDGTMFKNIKKLLPGNYILIENSSINIGRYAPAPGHEEFMDMSEEDCIDRFYHVFSESIERHMISDVPVGAFLSGGIDSSLMVGVMSKISSRPVETFSIGYGKGGENFDECEYSRMIAKRFNTNHREFILNPDIMDVLPRIVAKFDEPVGNASAIPNYYLSEKVREHVKVALSGLGGDELCAGYERYAGAAYFASYYKKLPPALRRLCLKMANSLPDSKQGKHLPGRLKRFVNYASLPLKELYYNLIAKFSDAEKQQLLNMGGFNPAQDGYSIYSSYWKGASSEDDLHKLLAIDLKTYLVDDLLALTDRVSMAHSLEVRVPFVDNEVFKFFWSLPSNLKIKGFSKKYFLKIAAERMLPKEVIYRPKKGFSFPLTVWFRGPLKNYVMEMLSPDSLRRAGIFNAKYVRAVLDEHFSGRANHDEKIFSLLSFAVWHRLYFEEGIYEDSEPAFEDLPVAAELPFFNSPPSGS